MYTQYGEKRMYCERCHKDDADVIKHLKIRRLANKVFEFNRSRDAMVCEDCYKSRPHMNMTYLVETIRNG